MFRDARLKIDRANKHIEDFKSVLGTLKDSYVSTIEQDVKAGGQSLKYASSACDSIHRELALMWRTC